MADESTTQPWNSNAGEQQQVFQGHFRLHESLGSGASGTVYRATTEMPLARLDAGHEVAVKFLRQELMTDPLAQGQLAKEGELGQQFDHPNLVRIYGVETVQVLGLPLTYLVMELVQGRSLRKFLQESGSAVEELARRIGLDAARGLAALHQRGVVHRDVKPENLALTEDGQVKVMDLGLARQGAEAGGYGSSGSGSSGSGSSGSGSSVYGFSGNLSYAAPEVLQGQKATALSDLYSLGVVLFEVVTGRHPFAREGMQADDMIHAHTHSQPPRPSHFKPRISAFLEQLILDLLQKDPSQRPPSARSLVATLIRGENSRYWLRHEQQAPSLASMRRLRAMRRPAELSFVGRKKELRVLDKMLHRVSTGHGRALQIGGPQGMGRRRMLDEWLQDKLDSNPELVFLGAQAVEEQGLQRAATFAHMLLEWFLRGDLPDSPQAQQRLASRIFNESGLSETEAQRLAAVVCATDANTSPQERANLIVRVLDDIMDLGGPLILRLDNAEELSTTAWLVLERLLDNIQNKQLLLILVSLHEHSSNPGISSLALRGLTSNEYAQLAAQLFAEGQIPHQLIADAHKILAGSPGNLLEALRSLRAEEKLGGILGHYFLLDEIQEVRPAQGLLQRLQSRINRLNPQQRFVHMAAAILGNSFSLADLADLLGQTELSVLEALSVFQGRIVKTSRGKGTFRHRDFRRSILRMMPVEARRRLHRQAAWVLEDRGADSLEFGLHLSRAGEHVHSLEPLLQGLEQLVAIGSRQQSLRISRRLRIHLNALARKPEYNQLRLRYLHLDGKVLQLDHKETAARLSLRKAACLAKVLQQPEARAAALVDLGQLELDVGRLRASMRHLQQALSLPGDFSPSLQAKGLAIMARIHGYRGRTADALDFMQQALAQLPDIKSEQWAHLQVDMARLQGLRNQHMAALSHYDQAAQAFAELGSATGQLREQLHRGHLLASMGHREKAQAMLEAAVEGAQQLSNPRAKAKALLFLGEQSVLHGDKEAATDQLLQAIALARQQQDLITQSMAQLYLQSMGQKVEAKRPELPVQLMFWRLLQAESQRRAGHDDEARHSLTATTRLERQITVPLHLHRRLLWATGRKHSDKQLVQEIAADLPVGNMRRRFLAFQKKLALQFLAG